jgi:hypothetical protein
MGAGTVGKEDIMNHDAPAYGLWVLVAINSLVFILFAFSFTHPKTSRDWRSFSAFSERRSSFRYFEPPIVLFGVDLSGRITSLQDRFGDSVSRDLPLALEGWPRIMQRVSRFPRATRLSSKSFGPIQTSNAYPISCRTDSN